jgi:hypothetical protein
MDWEEIPLKGLVPPSRGGHCTAVCEVESPSGTAEENGGAREGSTRARFLAIFGGADPFGISCADLYLVDLKDFFVRGFSPRLSTTGEIAKPADWPQPRCGHAGITHQGSLLIFGGARPVPTVALFNDVWECRIQHSSDSSQSAIWTSASSDAASPSSTPLWSQWTTTGTPPCPRHAHALTKLENQSRKSSAMLVLGGSDNEKQLGDCFLLDLTTKVWSEVLIPSSKPIIPREMSSACTVSPLVVEEGQLGSADSSVVTVVWGGGVNAEFGVLGDGHVLQFRATQEGAGSALFLLSDVSSASTALGDQGRACHSLVYHQSLSRAAEEKTILALGGIAGMDPTTDAILQLGIDNVELKHKADVLRKRSRSGAEQDEAVVLGLGHSALTTRSSVSAPSHTFVVSGLIPNAVSTQLQIFRMTVRA